jgi:hypothetical protein
MKAKLLVRQRVEVNAKGFAEIVIWQLLQPLAGSVHSFKYRLAYVVSGVCVMRYDNEAGKGDHRHLHGIESRYGFTTPRKLGADFFDDIKRYQHDRTDH